MKIGDAANSDTPPLDDGLPAEGFDRDLVNVFAEDHRARAAQAPSSTSDPDTAAQQAEGSEVSPEMAVSGDTAGAGPLDEAPSPADHVEAGGEGSAPTAPPTVEEGATGAPATPTVPAELPEYYDLYINGQIQRFSPADVETLWRNYATVQTLTPEQLNAINAYVSGQAPLPTPPGTATTTPGVEGTPQTAPASSAPTPTAPSAPSSLVPGVDDDELDPNVRAILIAQREQAALLEQRLAAVETQSQYAMQLPIQAQREQVATAAGAELQTKYGLNDPEMEVLVKRVGENNLVALYEAQPGYDLARAIDAAVTQTMWSDDFFRQRLIDAQVSSKAQAEKLAEKKNLSSSLGGTTGSTDRTPPPKATHGGIDMSGLESAISEALQSGR